MASVRRLKNRIISIEQNGPPHISLREHFNTFLKGGMTQESLIGHIEEARADASQDSVKEQVTSSAQHSQIAQTPDAEAILKHALEIQGGASLNGESTQTDTTDTPIEGTAKPKPKPKPKPDYFSEGLIPVSTIADSSVALASAQKESPGGCVLL